MKDNTQPTNVLEENSNEVIEQIEESQDLIILSGSASIVNSGEFEARNDGATPISNRRATSDDVTNFS